MNEKSFKFLNYSFDSTTFQATFNYLGADNTSYAEKISFQKPKSSNYDKNLLDRALFLAFILIGTSYYKSHPTPKISLETKIDDFQARFFSKVYQEGLSQFAFENNLTRSNLAHFEGTPTATPTPLSYSGNGFLVLQSGGKDSLLTATILKEKNIPFVPLYISSSESYPQILDKIGQPIILKRQIDLKNLQKSAGKNGHVPVTYIVKSLALIQAILCQKNTILTSIGQEGNEPTTFIEDLPINHQWSKTWEAEQLFAQYVKNYISPDINIGSLLRPFSELKIAEQFSKKCWQTFGNSFSSCNVANYQQQNNNSKLKWCGNCPKCANSYLLFSPFIPAKEQQALFANKDLFSEKSLETTFKGLLGIDNAPKPFECIGEIAELRKAYHLRQKDYKQLPFDVPKSEFDYNQLGPSQSFVKQLLNL